MKKTSSLLAFSRLQHNEILSPWDLTSWLMPAEYVKQGFIYAICALIFLQKRHHRTFSEDERIQAQENVKRVEDDDGGEISEPEDPLMLQRDAKDWKVRVKRPLEAIVFVLMEIAQLGTRSLRGSWIVEIPPSCY